jgi:hypothetical protein
MDGKKMTDKSEEKEIQYTCAPILVPVTNGLISGAASVIGAYIFRPIWNQITKFWKPSKKYMVFISKGEWFDKGTEVFDATAYINRDKPIRITQEYFDKTWKSGSMLYGDGESFLGLGLRNGNWDEEMCSIDEFDISYTNKQYGEK